MTRQFTYTGKPAKYGNRKTPCNYGHTHGSAKEAARCDELHLAERAGAISNLIVQPRYDLIVNGVKVGRYTGDFRYFENNAAILEDVKGGKATKTEAYKLRKRLLEAVYPGVKILETGA